MTIERPGAGGSALKRLYVVVAPEKIRGIYETWDECRSALAGTTGVRFQSVPSRAKAEAMLRGEATVLPMGNFAFTDGNASGGVGIVLVGQGPKGPVSVRETATSVWKVFAGRNVPGLESPQAVTEALQEIHQVLAEMAALYHVLRTAPFNRRLTVVHDYKGVAEWMEGRWRARNPIVMVLVGVCLDLLRDRWLTVVFRHQKAHQSQAAGRDDYVRWNHRADILATRGARASSRLPTRTST